MPELGDDRAEQAFREALSVRGDEAPRDPLEVPRGSSRRTWWVAGAAAAVVVTAIAVPAVLVGGDENGSEVVDTTSPSPTLSDGFRWLGYRSVEVQVPTGWPLEFSPTRPDCADLGPSYRGPDHPYVEIDPGQIGSVDIGCAAPDVPADLPEEFGVLPFELWQPHVTLADPWEEERPDGAWSYRGWRLTRSTDNGVQVSVLASPDQPDLTEAVLESAHTVTVDANGCETTSAVQAVEFVRPTAPGVPDPDEVASVSVCQYDRHGTEDAGLVGSRQIAGKDARALTRAIVTAPEGSGPNNPGNCLADEFGEHAIVLRFAEAPTPSGTDTPEAYVYSTSCRGNGIVDDSHQWQLTRENCLPLYEPPVVLWLSHQGVGGVCLPPPE